MENKTSLKILRMKSYLIDEIQKIADKENRTFTNMVETLLIRQIHSETLKNKL